MSDKKRGDKMIFLIRKNRTPETLTKKYGKISTAKAHKLFLEAKISMSEYYDFSAWLDEHKNKEW